MLKPKCYRYWDQEALYSFTQTIIDPTRQRPTVLVPNPFYMVYEGAALLCGAKPFFASLSTRAPANTRGMRCRSRYGRMCNC
jgi:aspartate/methionine/tyrosine aminotransferase